jgi:acetyltransferase-like isoleucine patch superfamily enzyme
MTERAGGLLSAFSGALVRYRLRGCRVVGEGTQVKGRVWVRGRGIIRLGERVVLDARRAPIELHATHPTSEIVLGDDVVIEGGTSIEAEASIRIGARVHIGEFCRIMDSHFHPLRGDRSKRPPPSAVVVEDDVRMGARSILVAGSHIEHDVVICPGTVVTRRVRAGLMVRGAPFQVVTTGAGS